MSFRNEFEQARDFLILHRADYDYAYGHFKWPKLEYFNWALDYFDPMAAQNDHLALWIVDEQGKEEKYSFAQLSERSNQVANYLRKQGLRKGDSLFILLDEEVALWELMLAAMKIGVVMVPANPLLSLGELQDRLSREPVKAIVTSAKYASRFQVSESGPKALVTGSAEGLPAGWLSLEDSRQEKTFFVHSDAETTKGSDPLFRFFVASTTPKPKVVEHSHVSFPVGHLSTMYWMGVHPGDIHLGVSAPGWSMHAWNNFIAPWNAEATVLVLKQDRFDAKKILEALVQYKVTTFCAPPTVWRFLLQEGLASYDVSIREALSSGEPLNEEVVTIVYKAWEVFVRDGYGQTETTMLVGNPPEDRTGVGTMGKPLPGYEIVLRDDENQEADQGEICVRLEKGPLGLMSGLPGDSEVYATGDKATLDYSGNYIFEMRKDSLFKSADYRISPYELEFALRDYPAIAEVVVIPSSDPIRESVPKALVTLSKGFEPTREVALDIMNFSRQRLAPFKRVRRVEFIEVPKNTSGEIPRQELALREKDRRDKDERSTYEFWEEDAKIPLHETWAQDFP